MGWDWLKALEEPRSALLKAACCFELLLTFGSMLGYAWRMTVVDESQSWASRRWMSREKVARAEGGQSSLNICVHVWEGQHGRSSWK